MGQPEKKLQHVKEILQQSMELTGGKILVKSLLQLHVFIIALGSHSSCGFAPISGSRPKSSWMKLHTYPTPNPESIEQDIQEIDDIMMQVDSPVSIRMVARKELVSG